MAVSAVDQAPALEPFDGQCPVCRTTVLVVDLRGIDVVLEIDEVLETFPCPVCAQVEAKQHRRGQCPRCGGTGRLGGSLPAFGVAVAEDGRARYFRGVREAGEAVYREHSCRVA